MVSETPERPAKQRRSRPISIRRKESGKHGFSLYTRALADPHIYLWDWSAKMDGWLSIFAHWSGDLLLLFLHFMARWAVFWMLYGPMGRFLDVIWAGWSFVGIAKGRLGGATYLALATFSSGRWGGTRKAEGSRLRFGGCVTNTP